MMTARLTAISTRVLPLLLLGIAPLDVAARGYQAEVIHAVGQLTEGKLKEAIHTIGRARRAKAVPELDALVGLAALAGGERAAAVRQLDSAIRRGSTEPLVFYWAGRAALAAGQPAAALTRMQEALAVGGDKPYLRMGHALVLLHLGRQDRAVKSLLVVAAVEPNLLDPSLYPQPLEGAIALLGRMLRRFPEPVQLRRTQGHLLWRVGQVLAAKKHFEHLISKRPRDADALQMLARCQMALGRTEEGLKLANLALRRAPGSPRALATRGEILLDSGKADLAHKDLRRAADGLPRDGRLLNRLAHACTEAEKPSCARRFFLYALRRDPKNAAAHFGIGLHYQHSKKHKRAKAAFRRAIVLDPGNPSYRRVAARFADLHGDRVWSRRLLAEARHLERGARRFTNRVKAANRRTQRQVAALLALQRSRSCGDRDCLGAIAKAPLPSRLFLKAHLVLRKNSNKGLATKFLETLRDRIKPRRLLLADPSLLVQKGKTLSGQWFILRRRFPLVIPGFLY